MSAPALRLRPRLTPALAATLLVTLVVLQAAGIVALGARLFGDETPGAITRSPP